MVNESQLWKTHVTKDDNKRYKNNGTHKESWCNYCIRHEARQLRSAQLDAVSMGARTDEAESEAVLEKRVRDNTNPRPSKVKEWWEHLAKKCAHVPDHVKEEAQRELEMRRQKEDHNRRVRDANKENSAQSLPAIVAPSSVPATPSRTIILSRTESLASVNSTISPNHSTPESSLSPHGRSGLIPSSMDGSPPYYGEIFSQTQPWSEARQAEFAADLCRLVIVCNMAWLAVEMPYWRAFFAKWLPSALMPGRQELSGRVLNEEADKVVAEMKVKVEGRYGTGQCDGWKNVSKTSIIGTMVNVEYTPHILHVDNVTDKPKTAVELLKLVEREIRYAVEVLKVVIVAWCTDASGESAKMRRLLVRKMPHLVVVDCWAHQKINLFCVKINLIVGDIFKITHRFVEIINNALEVVKWFNNHSRALGLLRDAQMAKFGLTLTLILPVLTRWTSHYLSVTRLVKLELAFKQLLLDAGENLEVLIVCAGTKADAKRKAKEVLDILERPDFWPDLRS
ncbi:hypothetical protein HYDPIDRAFT_169663 [Hydnomerulius pinastri MD-312]|uniref:DUF659 domain-containing protein n=1 Tax=Hydnomerulius pinastri MD-312 TaxID=994086 RepID=A0A0C9V6X8_9AGAM|nr:hypothetical protein HYDPIDRAFT_169663 [Hydnomerulius pinastri MD-312]